MSILGVMLKKDLLEQSRSKHIIILIFLFLFVAIASPIISKLTPMIMQSILPNQLKITISEPTFIDAVDQFIKNTSQLAIIILIFMVAGTVTGEKSSKTLELLFVKPVPREIFIISKFLSRYITIGLTYFINSLFFYLYTISIFKTFSFVNFLIVDLLMMFYIFLIVTFTIFASTFSRKTIIAAISGFVIFIFFNYILSLFKKISDFLPNYILGNYRSIITYGFTKNLWGSLIVILGLIILFILFSILIFKKQEL